MEKRLILFLVLTLALSLVWFRLFPAPKAPPKEEPIRTTRTEGDPVGPLPGEPGSGTGGSEPGSTVEPAPEVELLPEVRTVRSSENVQWTFSSKGAALVGAALVHYAAETWDDSPYQVLDESASEGGNLTVEVIDADGRPLEAAAASNWELVSGGEPDAGGPLTYRRSLPATGLVLEKEFSFPERVEGVDRGPFHVEVALRVRVADREKAARLRDGVRFRMVGVEGLNLRGEGAAGIKPDALVMTAGRTDPEDFGPDDKIQVYPEPDEQGAERHVRWFGVHGRFFLAAVMVVDPVGTDLPFVRIVPMEHEIREKNGPQAEAETKKVENHRLEADFTVPLPEGSEASERRFQFFAGPMDEDVLQGPYEELSAFVDYGWLGIPRLLLFLLGLIQLVVGNWGVAIIVLTLLVRFAMFPLSRKSQVSMQKYQRQMARVKPKMDALKERYKGNKQKLNQEMMRLYKEEGVRPVPGGCLVMLIQLPIFIGLYRALQYSVDLRHAGFLWAEDLTAPDHLLYLGGGWFLIPEWLNLFPILMGITWYLSAAMAPKPADPQQAQTMKMMKWMPVLFTFFLYSFASGLALYMVVSSSWSIFETKVVKKLLFKDEAIPAAGPAPTFRKGR